MTKAMLSSLKEALSAGQVVVLAGTGVSANSCGGRDLATWRGLLRNGVQRCADIDGRLDPSWVDRCYADLESNDLGDLLTVAEKISQRLGAPHNGEWSRWLRETVGSLNFTSIELVDAIAALNTPVFTTNYDDAFASVIPDQPATWRDSNRMDHILSRNERAVMHLHGHWRSPKSVVLGIKSYQVIGDNEFIQAIERQLVLSHSILFIGYGDGLDDPNWQPIVEFMNRAGRSVEKRHYFLCTSDQFEQQSHRFQGTRIHPISYGDYPDLAGFVRGLGNYSTIGLESLVSERARVSVEVHEANVLRVAVGLIVDKNKVVLVHRRQREGALDWQFPAGFVGPMEDARDAIVEEVLKETGLVCRAASTALGTRIHPVTRVPCVYYELTWFDGVLTNGDIAENIDVRWVNCDRVTSYIDSENIYPPILERLLEHDD